MFVPLTAQPSYSHAATGESPVHYSSGCSVIVPVGDLGEGTLRFRGFIYPDVTGGKSLVNATGIAESLTLGRSTGCGGLIGPGLLMEKNILGDCLNNGDLWFLGSSEIFTPRFVLLS